MIKWITSHSLCRHTLFYYRTICYFVISLEIFQNFYFPRTSNNIYIKYASAELKSFQLVTVDNSLRHKSKINKIHNFVNFLIFFNEKKKQTLSMKKLCGLTSFNLCKWIWSLSNKKKYKTKMCLLLISFWLFRFIFKNHCRYYFFLWENSTEEKIEIFIDRK